METPTKKSKVSLRLMHGTDIAVGPGKADILEAIRETGSIAGAGRRMNMSYRRAWALVETMNACFRSPLVETSKGGAGRGGAQLTPLGEEVLVRYRAMHTKAENIVAADMRALSAFLKD
ncbi:MAG: winged helix-turn-helix domain-containing protein [Alphaproteobacteria bacterium]